MAKILIIIPVENYDEAERYYRDILSFSFQDEIFSLPTGSLDVALKLMLVDEEAKIDFPPKKRFWHHNDETGRLNLVSRADHGDNHGIYHPTGSGGRDKWGGGEAGRNGKLNQATGCPL